MGMKHVNMRKLPAMAQEERRRQVIGLRQRGADPLGGSLQWGKINRHLSLRASPP